MPQDQEPILVRGSPFAVHGMDRPQPPVVTPGSLSTLPPVTPPSDAVILFDGSSADAWQLAGGSPCPWTVADGCLTVVPKSGSILSKEHYGDCQLHVEWSAPTEIEGDGQKRGNSGVFLHDLYEVQVLDCFANETYPDGSTAAIYGQHPPLVNACCKPGQWHVYDILWERPRFDGDLLLRPARITVLHNGVVVQLHKELHGPTRPRQPYYEPHGRGPIQLQDHGNPVRFRNIWVRDLEV